MKHITIIHNDTSATITYNPQDSRALSDILHEHGYVLNTACGGNGSCGKCGVYIDSDTKSVRACSYYPDIDITVTIPDGSLLEITKTYNDKQILYDNKEKNTQYHNNENRYYCAIDIGSTSISVLIANDEDIIARDMFFNSTIKAGADIITRLQRASEGRLEELNRMLRADITDAIARLLQKTGISPASLCRVAIAANSTMQHLLMALDCSGMCSYPFTPKATCFPSMKLTDILFDGSNYYNTLKNCSANLLIIPSYSAFIGGDIISGLYSLKRNPKFNLKSAQKNDPFMLIDLGTNAELVLATGGLLLCTSAAAGPAFEAAGINCGIPCVAGAIDSIKLRRKNDGTIAVSYHTISEKNPIGICGSGVISLISELLRLEVIDTYGTFEDRYSDGIHIINSDCNALCITQDDIRMMQLAIAAIRTGIELLIRHSDVNAGDIGKVFISGSFGSSLDIDSVNNINLFPPEWFSSPDRIIISGNTSLKGALQACRDSNAISHCKNIIASCSELELNELPEFNDAFLHNINF